MTPTDPIVSTSWLASRLGERKTAPMDASWFMPGVSRDPKAEFALTHIPGARFFAIDEVCDHQTDLPHMLASPQSFTAAMRTLGVDHDATVVAYDSHGLFSAARLWWTLRAMGHDDVVVLDGGLPRWRAEGRPLEQGWPAVGPGDFEAAPRPALVRDLAAMQRLVAEGSAQIIDARGGARFRGEAPEPRPGLRSGHMPGAKNLPFDQLIENGSLRDATALSDVFLAAGVDLSRPLVTTCGSGLTASVLALGLARLGRWDAAVYDGSWSEWGAEANTPVESGP
ncbi:MAG TPA: 3-mercaptopyruvate sulfurtransferase [Caulobacteraceae bacterium]|jgi:thiosulfate/3-mercaptopyruvate sulfurtransferase|nr:3-mercaptopyruvate sulfurtransferase [Caulobacteraceae bacterium]